MPSQSLYARNAPAPPVVTFSFSVDPRLPGQEKEIEQGED